MTTIASTLVAAEQRATEAVRPLTVDELDAVAGGKIMSTTFTVGNDVWVVAASAKGYGVTHIHIGN